MARIRLLRIEDVAELFGVHQNTVRRWCDRGQLQCIRLPGKGERRFTQNQVNELLLKIGLDPTELEQLESGPHGDAKDNDTNSDEEGGRGQYPEPYRNETCAEAVRAAIRPGEVFTFSELFGRVKRRGPWKDSTIWQHLMSLVVNLPPARHQWKSARPFLFLRGDGRYEIYDPAAHPQVRS